MLAYCSYYTYWRGLPMIVYTMPKPVAELASGDLIISVDRVLRLETKTQTMAGYAEWSYTRHVTDNTITRGTINLRLDSNATVVCTDIRDGAVITP